jgi:lipopolysaccharide export system protein LptA
VKQRSLLLACAVAALFGTTALAQDGSGPFGGFKHDREAPIEITSQNLEVRQAEQVALFKGDVVAGQGTLRLTAAEMDVHYTENSEGDDATGAIRRIEARGNVFLSNGAETAQGDWGEYKVEDGMVRMRGNVILTQGGNARKGQELEIDLNTGVASMTGGVGLVFTPKRKEESQEETAPASGN